MAPSITREGMATLRRNNQKRDGEAFHESEAKYRSLFENALDAMFLTEPDGKVLAANPAACAMFGMSEEELRRVGRAGITNHADPRHAAAIEERARHDKVTAELTYVRKDGTIFPAEVQSVVWGNGKKRSFVTIRDITARKWAEDELKTILRTAMDGFYIVDLEGRILETNDSYCSMVGYRREELLAMSIKDVEAVESEEVIKGRIKQIMETGQARFETKHKRKDGEIIVIEASCNYLPQEKKRLFVFMRDITERKQAGLELRESEQRYRAIGESIDYGVWICAPDGRNIYTSPSFLKLVGITQEQCSDFGWGDILHPDDAARTIAAWKECVRTGGTWDIEHRFRGVDGQWHPILARGVPVRDEHGQITCWAGINLDISRVKKAKDALQEAQAKLKAHAEDLERIVAKRTAALREQTAERERLQKELLKISEREKQLISQELHDGLCQNLAGTAFMSSLLHQQMAAKKVPEAKAAKQICDLLNTSVNEARNLSHGLHPVGPEGEALMNSLSQLAGTVRNLFHIKCTFRCPEPVVIENGTVSTYLYRITQEAINNARKHGEADRLTISLRSSLKGLILKIRDNGIGIPKIPKKSGMGLSIINRRASEIGATVSVRRGQKNGTVVTCTLPTRS